MFPGSPRSHASLGTRVLRTLPSTPSHVHTRAPVFCAPPKAPNRARQFQDANPIRCRGTKGLECSPIAHEVADEEGEEVDDPLDADPSELAVEAEDVDVELWLRAPVGVDLVTVRPRAWIS
eukprot:425340-Pyramimonas_sp.AAC.1